MLEKNRKRKKADTVQEGLTDTIPYENNLQQINEKLGITKSEIKNILRKKQYTMITGVIFSMATIIIGTLGFAGSHYGGISIQDFEMFRWFL